MSLISESYYFFSIYRTTYVSFRKNCQKLSPCLVKIKAQCYKYNTFDSMDDNFLTCRGGACDYVDNPLTYRG